MFSEILARLISACTAEQNSGLVYYRPNYYNTDDLETWNRTGYLIMMADKIRMTAYRNAINKLAGGKVVLEIGAGAYCPLSRMCIDAGAKKVYAIEGNQAAFAMLRDEIKKEGLEGKIEAIHGFSNAIRALPEKAELLVHELIGSIGSDEGMGAFVADAKKRFLTEQASFIPLSSRTLIAPVAWKGRFSLYNSAFRVLRFVNKPHNPFRLKNHDLGNLYCVWNLPEEDLIHSPLEFERIEFKENYLLEESKRLSFRIEKKSVLNGFYLWGIVAVDEDNVIDCYRCTSWPAIYFEISKQGITLVPGDELVFETYRNIRGVPQYSGSVYIIRNSERIDIGAPLEVGV
jgi:hypothetical protein